MIKKKAELLIKTLLLATKKIESFFFISILCSSINLIPNLLWLDVSKKKLLLSREIIKRADQMHILHMPSNIITNLVPLFSFIIIT
tara:strand:+ start:348 stop:605 length:258 start_codon:yes stop_codon:yes gene_type:complete